MRGFLIRGGLGLASQAGGTSTTVPGPPTIGTATAGNTTASITFSQPASNGGSPITGYTATSSPGGLQGSGSSSPITVNGLSNGTSYTFTVTATNAVGIGPPSSQSNSVTPSGAGVPLAVTNFRITQQGDSTNNQFSPNDHAITMTWNASAGATSYNVMRGINGAAKTVYASPGNVLTFTDNAATNAFSAENIFQQSVRTPTNGTGPTTVYDYDIMPVNGSGQGPAPTDCQLWFYKDGVEYAAGFQDLSFGMNSVNFADTTLVPPTGSADIACNISGAGAGLQLPSYSPGTWIYGCECGAYNYFNVTCKPISSAQTWNFAVHRRVTIGDAIGPPRILLNLLNYGPAPQTGVWATYKIPLFDLGYGVGNLTGVISSGVLTVTGLSGALLDVGTWLTWAGQTTPTYINNTPAQSGNGTYSVAGQTNQSSIAMVSHCSNFYKFQIVSTNGSNGNVFGATNAYLSRV